jgi:hypothetical protein
VLTDHQHSVSNLFALPAPIEGIIDVVRRGRVQDDICLRVRLRRHIRYINEEQRAWDGHLGFRWVYRHFPVNAVSDRMAQRRECLFRLVLNSTYIPTSPPNSPIRTTLAGRHRAHGALHPKEGKNVPSHSPMMTSQLDLGRLDREASMRKSARYWWCERYTVTQARLHGLGYWRPDIA